MDVTQFRNANFYRVAFSGDTNLYLLFLRLGIYYLADYGEMIYIVPLTIFGDRSASAVRKLLKSPPFSPDIAARFYRGDILFPGVDQAVGIVRIRRSIPNVSIIVSGGDNIQEARSTQFKTDIAKVTEAVPQNGLWQGNWLVAQNQISLDIWDNAKVVSSDPSMRLGSLLDANFETKQGDVNATLLNPLRLGRHEGSFSNGNVAIYKGEDVQPYAPLPPLPSEWARTLQGGLNNSVNRGTILVSQVLEQLKQIHNKENGIVLRHVARLNTREHLIASWFERNSDLPIAFTNAVWRMGLKSSATEQNAKAVLALLNSKTIAFLINLFSTNNNVSKDELDRVPIPNPQTLPVKLLADLVNQLLEERTSLENDIIAKFGAKLPEYDEKVYVKPSMVLGTSRLPKLTIADLVGRGELRNVGPMSGRIKALRLRNSIICTATPSDPNTAVFSKVLDLFLSEPEHEKETWSQAQYWLLPDPLAANAWLDMYNTISQQAQEKWEQFMVLQQKVDNVVSDRYGFDSTMRTAIAEGLPWAKRRRNNLSNDRTKT